MQTMETDTIQDEEDLALALTNSPPAQSPTLLPSPIANAVSLVTRSSSLYLRLGSFIGGLALDGARVTTLTGLELSRAVIEGILSRGGRDVAQRSTGELGRAEAESVLERSIGTLHSTITAVSFAASTGFYFSATALGSATDLSQQLLASLDSILGSTDSSRAISSIITLIRREFQNPATGREGEKVGVADLLIGICGLALLQRWCWKLTEAEYQDKKYEEVLWDVVVLTNGRRADVVGHVPILARSNSSSFVTPDGSELLEAVERDTGNEDSEDDLPEINLKQSIMQSLPAKASVSITTEITTSKIITVEITGAKPPDLILPSGVEIIDENAPLPSRNIDDDGSDAQLQGPRYRIVYRILKNQLRGTNIQPESAIKDSVEAHEIVDMEMLDAPAIESRPTSLESSPEGLPEIAKKSRSHTAKRPGGAEVSASQPSTFDEGLKINASQKTSPGSAEIAANQKRSRKPMSASSSTSGSEKHPAKKIASSKLPALKKSQPERPSMKATDKKGSFRDALKRGSGVALSNLWSKDSGPDPNVTKPLPVKPPWNISTESMSNSRNNPPIPRRPSAVISTRDSPRPPQRGNPNYFSSRDLGLTQPSDIPRSPSRTSYYSIHERRRDSVVSHTDTYSIHSAEARPGSPTTFRAHLRAQSSLVRARSEKNIVSQSLTPTKNHQRSKSYVPSIYTLNTNASVNSLVLADRPRRSVFEDSETLEGLMRTGFVGGLFPQHHIIRNMTRFVKFASASYGSSFLRVMGIVASASPASREIDTKHHHEHHSFSNHTQLPPDTILLSSFVDPAGGTDSTGHTGTGVPMVHFVSLDHESKAVVLTCRGTLGFEDVLADMTCDYDFLRYRGREYSVHKGIHASARRLLDGAGGRVMATIKAALEEFPDYGLVMCGHSLGGGVTALLAIMISEPSPDPSSTAFVTAISTSPRLLTSSSTEFSAIPANLQLPPGRPIHVYAYGPPATLSPSLRVETRGLITTIVNGQDLVPYLSLGVLHDMQAVALAFKNDDSGAKGEVRNRVWEGLKGGFADRWYNRTGESVGTTEDDQWAYSALKALRASMLSSKLVPPGEVFVVETMPVLQRDMERGLGRPATRSVLRYVRDVERRFGEVRFGGSMLLDHSPGRYEASLNALGKGVLG